MKLLGELIRDEEGAAAVEYALIAMLIAVVISVAAYALGGSLCAVFNGIAAGFGGSGSYAPVACQ
nr:Flp family type IVb pilin [Lacisediminimonas profundi]